MSLTFSLSDDSTSVEAKKSQLETSIKNLIAKYGEFKLTSLTLTSGSRRRLLASTQATAAMTTTTAAAATKAKDGIAKSGDADLATMASSLGFTYVQGSAKVEVTEPAATAASGPSVAAIVGGVVGGVGGGGLVAGGIAWYVLRKRRSVAAGSGAPARPQAIAVAGTQPGASGVPMASSAPVAPVASG